MFFIALAAITPGNSQLSAQIPSTTAILHKVDDHYNHLASLRAAFTERYSGLGLDRTETGTLLLKKPGRMRWNYTTPVGKVFVLDGSFGWFYTPGDSQATRIAAGKLDDLRSPLRLLLGHTRLARELDSPTVLAAGSGYTISGVPKGMSHRIREVTLGVTASGTIETIQILETDGAVTAFTFTSLQENIPTHDSDFTFQAPAEVAIVDGLAPI